MQPFTISRTPGWFAVLVAVMLTAGCDDDPTGPPQPQEDTVQPAADAIHLPPGTEGTISAYDAVTGEITLDADSPHAADIEVGSIIVGGDPVAAPAGLLREVTARTTAGDALVLQTVPALLTDAFANLRVRSTIPLTPDRMQKRRSAPGVRLEAGKRRDADFTLALDCVLHDADGDSTTTDDRVRLGGSFAFSAELEAYLAIEDGVLQACEFTLDSQRSSQLVLDPDAPRSFPEPLVRDLWYVELGPVRIADAVWLTPALTLQVRLEGDLTAQTEIARDHDADVRNGFAFARGGVPELYPVGEAAVRSDGDLAPYSDEFDLVIGPELTARSILYGVPGPTLTDHTGLHLAAAYDPSRTRIVSTLDVTVTGRSALDMEAGVIDLTWSGDHELFAGDLVERTVQIEDLGEIVIDQTPDALEGAAWRLTGPLTRTGAGDADLDAMPAGAYAIAFTPVPGYTVSSSQPDTLMAGGTISFHGTYTEIAGAGTVEVLVEPGGLPAAWDLMRSDSLVTSGHGSAVVDGVPPGGYTIYWHDVSGYATPEAGAQTLDPGGRIVFVGNYEPGGDLGVVTIDQTPDALPGAGWDLVGPREESGFGDAVFTDMPPGHYSLTWNEVEGYAQPRADADSLAAGGQLAFAGTYLPDAGDAVIHVDPEPDVLQADWSISGPAGYGDTGTGDQTLSGLDAGTYTVQWGDVPDFVAPATAVRYLPPGGEITITGSYASDDTLATRATPRDRTTRPSVGRRERR